MRACALLHGPHTSQRHTPRVHTQQASTHTARDPWPCSEGTCSERVHAARDHEARVTSTALTDRRRARATKAPGTSERSKTSILAARWGVYGTEEVSSGASIKGRTGEEDEGLVTDDGGGCDGGGDGVGREEDHDGGHEEGGQDISGSRGATTVEVITATKLRLR